MDIFVVVENWDCELYNCRGGEMSDVVAVFDSKAIAELYAEALFNYPFKSGKKGDCNEYSVEVVTKTLNPSISKILSEIDNLDFTPQGGIPGE